MEVWHLPRRKITRNEDDKIADEEEKASKRT